MFCARCDQPQTLFQAPSLYVMPDKYPTVPGHILIISRDHLPCYAVASAEALRELEWTTARVRAFLEETYATPVIAFENGIAGQTVPHAHLHLLPARITDLSTEATEYRDVTRIAGWQQVQEHFVHWGNYRYIEVGDKRYLIKGYSPVLRVLRQQLAEATGLTWGEHGPEKKTTPDDIREVERRWRTWHGLEEET